MDKMVSPIPKKPLIHILLVARCRKSRQFLLASEHPHTMPGLLLMATHLLPVVESFGKVIQQLFKLTVQKPFFQLSNEYESFYLLQDGGEVQVLLVESRDVWKPATKKVVWKSIPCWMKTMASGRDRLIYIRLFQTLAKFHLIPIKVQGKS